MVFFIPDLIAILHFHRQFIHKCCFLSDIRRFYVILIKCINKNMWLKTHKLFTRCNSECIAKYQYCNSKPNHFTINWKEVKTQMHMNQYPQFFKEFQSFMLEELNAETNIHKWKPFKFVYGFIELQLFACLIFCCNKTHYFL